MATVTIRYWAAAKAAAGTASDEVSAESVADALAQAEQLHPDAEFARVLSLCSILLDGTVVHPADRGAQLSGAVTVEALPPFAGG